MKRASTKPADCTPVDHQTMNAHNSIIAIRSANQKIPQSPEFDPQTGVNSE